MKIHCRPIIKSDNIEAVVDLHGLIWYTDDRDAIPSHVLIALQHTGSLLLGAFDDGRIIGFSLAFPGYNGGDSFLWSHATGVLPQYQGRGIGRQLKLLQRDLALAQGFDHIRWTYDPLQAGNANFNISQLGCRCNLYYEDFYGQVDDGLNVGLPTDRFEVTWRLMEQRTPAPLDPENCTAPFVLAIDAGGGPLEHVRLALEEPVIRVPIPEDINSLRTRDLDRAIKWRLATRAVFKKAFAAGYEVTGFTRHASQQGWGAYILQSKQIERGER